MKFLPTALALACVALGAQAQTKMYKCTGDGRTIYQQTACASAASASSAADNAATTSRAGGAPPAASPRAAAANKVAGSSPTASADTAGRLATARP